MTERFGDNVFYGALDPTHKRAYHSRVPVDGYAQGNSLRNAYGYAQNAGVILYQQHYPQDWMPQRWNYNISSPTGSFLNGDGTQTIAKFFWTALPFKYLVAEMMFFQHQATPQTDPILFSITFSASIATDSYDTSAWVSYRTYPQGTQTPPNDTSTPFPSFARVFIPLRTGVILGESTLTTIELKNLFNGDKLPLRPLSVYVYGILNQDIAGGIT